MIEKEHVSLKIMDVFLKFWKSCVALSAGSMYNVWCSCLEKVNNLAVC